ncbi:hypothetical protein AB0F46_28555 [Streptomyces sp. NPDC026665]|uniref:hypothetical protein n=1 Tax=Streptomyces sp. NPDC026665 TaxID=3154798 RepID=UPI0033E935C0
MAVLTAVVPLDPEAYDDIVPVREPSAALPAGVLEPLIAGPLLTLAVSALVIAAGTLRRLARATASLRQQLTWMACVTVVFLVVLVAVKVPVAGAVACFVCVAIAVGILRQNMLGIKVVLRRGLVYGTPTALVLSSYAGDCDRGLRPALPAPSRVGRRSAGGLRAHPAARAVTEAGGPAGVRTAGPLAGCRRPGTQAASQGGTDMLSGALRTVRAAGADVATRTFAVRRPDETYDAEYLKLQDALVSQLAVILRAVELITTVEQERDRVIEAERSWIVSGPRRPGPSPRCAASSSDASESTGRPGSRRGGTQARPSGGLRDGPC